MPSDVPLRCACGVVRGVAHDVSATTGKRLICYCGDCRAFAHVLERADDVLDDNGGTDIFPVVPAQIEIDDGQDQLRCIRLREGGLLRWYSGCCRTAIGNTLANRHAPHVGIIHTFMDHEADGRSRDEALGPICRAAFPSSASGDTTMVASYQRITYLGVARMALGLVANRLRGLHQPTPFFDARSGRPVAEPHVLSDDELESALARASKAP